MGHPYRDLIEQEAKRAEDDLGTFRSRALTVVTISSGIVALVTGAVTFGASDAERARGISDLAIILFAIALGLFLVAAVLALVANAPVDINRPSGADLEKLVTEEEWGQHKDNPDEQDREVSETLVAYLITLRAASDRAATWLKRAIEFQIGGLTIAAIAGIVTVATL